ncbi:MAG: hypothetical protein AAF628_29055, partial [Planctomycetota bacterium]
MLLRLTACVAFLGALSSAQSQPAPDPVLRRLGLHHASLQEIDAGTPAADGTLSVAVAFDGHDYVLDLRPTRLRTQAFRVLVDDGRTTTALDTPLPATYQGKLRGTTATAAATIRDGQITATVMFDDSLWGLQPVGPGRQHAVYRSDDVIPNGTRCGHPAHHTVLRLPTTTHGRCPPSDPASADAPAGVARGHQADPLHAAATPDHPGHLAALEAAG